MKPAKKKRKPVKTVPASAPAAIVKRPASNSLRMRAERAYINDSESNSLRWHWENGECFKAVSYATFERWSKVDGWVRQREDHWRSIQQRSLVLDANRAVKRRLAEVKGLEEQRDLLYELLQPVRNKDGSIKRDPVTGMPEFHVPLPPYDRLVKAFLDLDARVVERTVEAVSSALALSEEKTSGTVMMDPVARAFRLSETEAQHLAKALLLQRSPRLSETEVLDAEAEDEDGNKL